MGVGDRDRAGRLFVAAPFVGFLNYLVRTGRVVVISRVVEVTPNVSGQITEFAVKANSLVKADAVLFRIDPAPYEAQVRTIEAQLGFQDFRLSQMKHLQASNSGRAFDVEQRQSEVDQLSAHWTRRSTISSRRPSSPRPTALSPPPVEQG